MTKNEEKCEDQKMKKQYIIEVDESEIVEYWNEQTVKELGYQEYSLKQCPGIKVKPYRPTGDLISRNALKKELNFVYSCAYIESKSKEGIASDIIDVIDNAPTVEPFEPDYVGAERVKARQRGYEEGYHNGLEIGKTLNPKIKQGEWIDKMATEGYVVCPFCGKEITGGDLNFCVKCGADMRKGGTEE